MSSLHRNILITDLDKSDNDEAMNKIMDERNPTKQRKSALKRKTLNTLSGNFNRRSRSAECNAPQRTIQIDGQATQQQQQQQQQHKCSKEKAQSYLNELLQAKEQQMEKLLQRLSTLHKYNEQFAQENQQLQQHVNTLQHKMELLRKQIDNCDKCHQLSEQLKATLDEQKTLDADVKMLKTLVYRLNVQIEAYQDQLRLAKGTSGAGAAATASANDGGDHHHHRDSGSEFLPQTAKTSKTITEWGIGSSLNTHTLGPLLTSYDEMLRDKEELIQQYRQEFEHFTGELKRTIEENNRLLQQNETLKKDFSNWREERTRLQAQLEVCRSKVEAHARKSDLAKEKLVEVMHCYEQKVQTLVLDLEHTQSAYVRCKTELATLKSITSSSQSQDNIAQSLEECKNLLEELKRQHSKEKETFQRTIDDLNARRNEFQNRIDDLERQNATIRRDLETKTIANAELEKRNAELKHNFDVIKQSRDRLKARLRIALQWAQRLEEGQTNIQNTWDALKRLETVVKHKESQVRGLHARHLEEIDKMEKKLAQKEETIRTILKGKLTAGLTTEL